MADADFQQQHKLETYKSMVTISLEVFKYLALLNGGAAAGMLAAADKIVRILPAHTVRTAILCFVAGLVFDAVALFFSYWTQNTLYNETMGRTKADRHIWSIRISTVACALSLAAFCVGAGKAGLNIQTLPEPPAQAAPAKG